MKKITLFSSLLILFCLTWIGCNGIKKQAPTSNLFELVEKTPSLSTLKSALVAAKLDLALSDTAASYTVFAPSNDAFAKLPAGTLESLLADPSGSLKNILLYHVVNGIASFENLADGMQLTTLNDAEVSIKVVGTVISVNDVQLSVTPVLATNGIVFIIDTVLLPPAKPVTLMQVIEGSADHQTLKAALVAAKLDSTLINSETSLTIFAPTDAAFALLPKGTVQKLLMEPEGQLKNILLYHLIASKITSDNIAEGTVSTLLDKSVIEVSSKEGDLFVNNAKVIVKDLVASNGVIHVIDAVLLPK